MDSLVSAIEEYKMTYWFEDRMKYNQIEDSVLEIITPFLDGLNDGIMVYVQSLGNGNFKITDDGYTLWDLELLSISVDSCIINRLKNAMNLQSLVHDDGELYIIIENERDLPRFVFSFASFISTLSNTAPIMQLLKGDE